MPKVALAGNKIRREMLLRPDLDDWVLEMMGKPPGWSRNAVIEYCIEKIRNRSDGDSKADQILLELRRMSEAQEQVAEGLARLRAFHDYRLWLSFQPDEIHPSSYYYCVIKWIVEAVPAGADSMGSGEAVGRDRGSDAVARSGSRSVHGVPAAPAPRGRKFAGSVGGRPCRRSGRCRGGKRHRSAMRKP